MTYMVQYDHEKFGSRKEKKIFWENQLKYFSIKESMIRTKSLTNNIYSEIRFEFAKGQLISKCLFGVFNSSKKQT